jgi:alpha-galactosidase
MLPLVGCTAQVLEWFDLETPSRLRLDLENVTGAWHLLAYINWDDEPQDITVNLREFGLNPQMTYFAREFWAQKTHRISRGKLLRERLLPHDTLLLAVRPLINQQPQYLGSDLHISQGMEVVAWKTSPRRVVMKFERPGSAEGAVLLSLLRPPKKALLDAQDCPWQAVQGGMYKFLVKFNQAATLRVHR